MMTRIAYLKLAGFSLALMALLSGCAQNVRSNVTIYQRMEGLAPTKEAPRTYAIVKSPEQAKSLEWAQYEDLITQEMGPLGFSVAKATDKPRFNVEFHVRSSDQKYNVTDYAYPTFGVGVSRGYYGYNGRYGYDPFFSTPIPVQRSVEFIRHELKVSIFDTEVKDGKAIWEGKALTDSSRGESLTQAMPYLVRSLFSGFPGENGKTKTVTLPRIVNQ